MTTSGVQVEETVPVPAWILGYCIKCLRYREYDGPCQVCKTELDMPWEIRGELLTELARLILATQHLFQEEPEVKSALDPRWRSNMAWPDVRRKIVILRGVAAQRGVLPEELRAPLPSEGKTVIIEYDGDRWECFEDGKTGSIRRIRRVAVLEADATSGPAVAVSGMSQRLSGKHTCGYVVGSLRTRTPGCPGCEALNARDVQGTEYTTAKDRRLQDLAKAVGSQ